jgi:hypothetical protein
MTNLAAIYDWIAARALGRAASAANAQRGNSEYKLRALPNEQIELYIKRIDNSRLTRTVDRRDYAASIGISGGVPLASFAIILLLLPGAYNLLASRHMEKLRDENMQLQNDLRKVQVREAQVKSAHQLKAWAGKKYVEPAAGTVTYGAPPDTVVASLKKQ